MPDPGECPHPVESRLTDPESGIVSCGLCGLEMFDQRLRIGSRLVPPTKLLHRVTIRRRELERVALKISQELHTLDAIGSKIRDVQCAWPGCEVPPMIGSSWCPEHKRERAKENARERQRRRRDKLQGGGKN